MAWCAGKDAIVNAHFNIIGVRKSPFPFDQYCSTRRLPWFLQSDIEIEVDTAYRLHPEVANCVHAHDLKWKSGEYFLVVNGVIGRYEVVYIGII